MTTIWRAIVVMSGLGVAVVAAVFLLTRTDARHDIEQDVAFDDAFDLGPHGPERNRDVYGYGTTDVTQPLIAGEFGTWSFTYHVGRLGVDDGGRIFLLTDAVSDWVLQTDRPGDANYVSVATTGRGKVVAHVERRRAGPRPYWGGIVVTVVDGDLAPGSTVTITVGDRSQGGPGARAPRIAPGRVSEIRFVVDPLNNALPVRVQHSPTVQVVAGKVHRLEAVWPSEAAPGSHTWLLVKAKDENGNPARDYDGRVGIEGAEGFSGVPQTIRFEASGGSFHRLEGITVPNEGQHRLRIVDLDNRSLATATNTLTITPDLTLRPFCGDLHGQHPVSASHAAAYAAYARGFAGIDFMSWAANDFHVTQAAWQHTQDVTRAANEPGRFVVFPGYEWSATSARGGDHNVVHLDDGVPIHRSGYAEHDRRGYDPSTDRYRMADLLSALDPSRTIVMPHIGGRRADLGAFDPRFMPFIEVYSDHGQFEWFLREALERGLQAGFVASSDDAFGKLGDSPPGSSGLFAVHGGLTCAYAEDLTRTALWSAFKARRVYGTTGERIRLRFRAGAHWMGEAMSSAAPVTFSVDTVGTSGIERIELFRGTSLVERRMGASDSQSHLVKVIWRGAASKERARQTLWRGTLALSAGRIVSVAPYRLDHPGEGFERTGERSITFDTVTAGDEDGVVLDVDAPEGAALEFTSTTGARNQFGGGGGASPPVQFSVPLAAITAEDTVHDTGGIDREVVLRRVAREYPPAISFEWTEPAVPPGTSAYWVRVLQTDGATAWSSPIFVSR